MLNNEVKAVDPSAPCKEQVTTSESISIFRNESLKLTHRRSTSTSASTVISCSGSGNPVQNNHHHDAGSSIRNDPAYLCTKCHTRSTNSSSRSNSNRLLKLLCSECELLQRQEARRRWKNLACLTQTAIWWWVFVKDAGSTLAEDNNRSRLHNCPVNGNEQHNSPQRDHAIDIPPDANSKIFSTNEINPDNQGNDSSSSGARAARLVLRCHCTNMKTITINLVRSWVFIKWALRLLNVMIEACQATITQENGQKRISDSLYTKLAVLTSFTCLVIASVEIIGEGKRSKAKCQRNGYCCWFYYPERRLFGKFSLYFGVISSMIQFLINLITLIIERRFMKFDPSSLMLSFGHLVAGLADPGERLVVKCRIHGNCPVQCPKCEQDTHAL